jgi:parallel beta-helix repeat protein
MKLKDYGKNNKNNFLSQFRYKKTRGHIMKYSPLFLSCLLFLVFILTGCMEETPHVKTHMTYHVGGPFSDYYTITDAINNASDGFTIIISEGTYDEPLIIDKTLTIIGENQQKTKIISQGFYIGSKTLISIKAENCTLSDLNLINNENVSEELSITGIKIDAINTTIYNVTINNMKTGINIEDKKYCHISHNNIINNHIGIYTEHSSYNNITKNIVTNNREYGFQIWSGSSHNKITNNLFSYNGVAARIKGSNDNIVTNNIIQDNQMGLYLCCGASKNILYQNVFINNSIWHANDGQINTWYDETEQYGNYWDDYFEKYSDAQDNNGYWDIPYEIEGGNNQDMYPLVSMQ